MRLWRRDYSKYVGWRSAASDDSSSRTDAFMTGQLGRPGLGGFRSADLPARRPGFVRLLFRFDRTYLFHSVRLFSANNYAVDMAAPACVEVHLYRRDPRLDADDGPSAGTSASGRSVVVVRTLEPDRRNLASRWLDVDLRPDCPSPDARTSLPATDLARSAGDGNGDGDGDGDGDGRTLIRRPQAFGQLESIRLENDEVRESYRCVAQFVELRLHFSTAWIAISEVKFDNRKLPPKGYISYI
ncbi:unnamed protein product [Protopolystoma xenopodis]|uniref:Uncharacterized protein n=1 Tax=Protopolystoma xenopodis TaxID=117903 RepID=A0A448WUK5_9PLAT|nr:unnamed protein product [Protopolystoma xenopodis]